MMLSEKKASKKCVIFTILFALAILACVVVSITAVDNVILALVQKHIHRTLRNPARWIDILQNSARLFACTFALIYFLRFIEKGKQLRKNVKETILGYKDILFSRKSTFFFFGTILFLLFAYSTVLLANYFYADDVFRNYGGNRSWIGFSRYISEFASIFIHNSLRLTDIAPLTQVIAVVVSSATILSLSVSLTETLSVKSVLALSLIFIAPFYAENISYRFDAPYMALSLFFSAVPFLFKKDTKSFVFVSIVGLILTCISYQAALPLYILCTIYLFSTSFFKKEDIKQNLLFVAKAAASFVIALVIFKLLFMNKMTNDADDYFSTQIKISAFFKNIVAYIKATAPLSGGFFMKTMFIFSLALLFINGFTASKQNKVITIFVLPVILLASYALSFGPYLVFERPVFAPRALMGFNTFVALVLLANLSLGSGKKQIFSTVASILFVYSCLVFFFAYGNALKNQAKYENFRAHLVIQDLSELMKRDENCNICFKGSIGLCEKSRIVAKNHPLIKTLVPRKLSEGFLWNDDFLHDYNLTCTTKAIELSDDFLLIKQNYYHAIFQNENDFIIFLK